jgi:hypothetical protein
MEPILCKKHNVAKVPMRNRRNAPMLGCPVCHAAPQEQPAEQVVQPTDPTPTSAPKRRGLTLLALIGKR